MSAFADRLLESRKIVRELKALDSKRSYELRGSLYTEEMPIRLEETIFANTDEEAKKIARRKAGEYRNVEGYAVGLFVFNNKGKQIGYTYVRARNKFYIKSKKRNRRKI